MPKTKPSNPQLIRAQAKRATTTHKEVRRNWFPQQHITWFNFATQVFEVYKRPETDEEATAHLPQEPWILELYAELRAKGQQPITAMRGCYLELEVRLQKVKEEQNAREPRTN